MLEAVRILKATGLRNKRTIRIALWTGEEQGLIGSRAWVRDHFGTRDSLKADAGKFSVFRYRNPGNLVLFHYSKCVFDQVIWRHRDWIYNHARFRTFDAIYFIRLFRDCHILMNDSNSTLLCYGDGEARFGDSIHCCADNGNVQLDRTSELRF